MLRPFNGLHTSGEIRGPQNSSHTDGRTRRSKPNGERPHGNPPTRLKSRQADRILSRRSFTEPSRLWNFHAFACAQSIAKQKRLLQVKIISNYKKVVHKYIPVSQCAHNLSTGLFTLCLSCYLQIIGHYMCQFLYSPPRGGYFATCHSFLIPLRQRDLGCARGPEMGQYDQIRTAPENRTRIVT